jgi:hypothetical protein
MMRPFDHQRHPGAIAAWRELNRRVAEDLELERGHIPRAVVKWSTRDAEKVCLNWIEARLPGLTERTRG